jgi:hypothetical protein
MIDRELIVISQQAEGDSSTGEMSCFGLGDGKHRPAST